MSYCRAGSSMAVEAAAWAMGLNPARRISARAPAKRRFCSAVNSGSVSAAQKWVKAPSISTSGQRRHQASMASRSSPSRTPMRDMPVSIFRWASARRPHRAASSCMISSIRGVYTAWETPVRTARRSESSPAPPSTRIMHPTPPARSRSASSTMATAKALAPAATSFFAVRTPSWP